MNLDDIWEAKRAWHEQQRALSLPEKIRVLISLQKRVVEINELKRHLGLPEIPMRIWNTRP